MAWKTLHDCSSRRRFVLREWTLLLLALLICSCGTFSTRSYLREKMEAYFGPERSDFVTKEEFDRILQLADNSAYIRELSILLGRKTIASIPGWGDTLYYFDKDVSVSKIDLRIMSVFSEDPRSADGILDIYTKLNLKPTPGYVLSFLNGRYELMYKLISHLEPTSSKESIRKLVETMPSLKTLVLAQYLLKVWSKANPSEAEAKQLFDTINEENFEKLVSQSKLFSFAEVSVEWNERMLRGYSESLVYYHKLQEKLQ